MFKKHGGDGGNSPAGEADDAAGNLPRMEFRLVGRKTENSQKEEYFCDAADIVEAIAIAIRVFGPGDVEIRCWRGKSYQVRIFADRSWSLHPLYSL